MCIRVIHWYGVVEDSCRICIFICVNDIFYSRYGCVYRSVYILVIESW